MAKIDNTQIYRKKNPKGSDLIIATDTITGETITFTVESLFEGDITDKIDLSGLGESCIDFGSELTVKNVLLKYEELICKLISNVGGVVQKEFRVEPSLVNKGGSVNPIGSCIVDGEIITLSYFWSNKNYSFTSIDENELNTLTSATIFNDVGTFYAYMKCSSNAGRVYWSNFIFTVLSAQNILPNVVVSSDQIIQLPTNSVILSSTGTDSDGNITSYLWSKISGGAANITTPSLSTTEVTNLTEGSYVFQVTVTDNDGASAFGIITVQVQAEEVENIPPNVTVNPNLEIVLGDEVNLSATANDGDGTIVGIQWVKILGGTAIITTPNNYNTTVTGLEVDQYTFRATVTDDDGATAFDEVNVIVSESDLTSLVVDAGVDQSLNEGELLFLSGSTQVSNPITYLWTKVSGGTANINNPTNSSTSVGNLEQGSYTFRLDATDTVTNQTGMDTVSVIVSDEALIDLARPITLLKGDCDVTTDTISGIYIIDNFLNDGTILYSNPEATARFLGGDFQYKLDVSEAGIITNSFDCVFQVDFNGVVFNYDICEGDIGGDESNGDGGGSTGGGGTGNGDGGSGGGDFLDDFDGEPVNAL